MKGTIRMAHPKKAMMKVLSKQRPTPMMRVSESSDGSYIVEVIPKA